MRFAETTEELVGIIGSQKDDSGVFISDCETVVSILEYTMIRPQSESQWEGYSPCDLIASEILLML